MSPLALFAGPQGLILKWVVLAILLAAAMGWSYMQGIDRESDRRDAAELAAVAKELEGHRKLVAYGVDQAKKARAAGVAAVDFYLDLEEQKNAAKRAGTPLTATICPAAPGTPPIAGTQPPAPAGPAATRFTWEFVRLWDSALRDREGKPLFRDPEGAAGGPAGPATASPYTADDALTNHTRNEERADSCRRALRALNATIDGLEAKWDEQHGRKP